MPAPRSPAACDLSVFSSRTATFTASFPCSTTIRAPAPRAASHAAAQVTPEALHFAGRGAVSGYVVHRHGVLSGSVCAVWPRPNRRSCSASEGHPTSPTGTHLSGFSAKSQVAMRIRSRFESRHSPFTERPLTSGNAGHGPLYRSQWPNSGQTRQGCGPLARGRARRVMAVRGVRGARGRGDLQEARRRPRAAAAARMGARRGLRGARTGPGRRPPARLGPALRDPAHGLRRADLRRLPPRDQSSPVLDRAHHPTQADARPAAIGNITAEDVQDWVRGQETGEADPSAPETSGSTDRPHRGPERTATVCCGASCRLRATPTRRCLTKTAAARVSPAPTTRRPKGWSSSSKTSTSAPAT